MNTEILIVTYLRDLEYLRWNLKSIRKFASGFHNVRLLVPNQEMQKFRFELREFSDLIMCDGYPRVDDSRLWHLQHQAMKCRADQICPGTDFILFLDSDCVLTEPVTPEDYFVDEKPVLLIEEYSRLPANHPWKPTVDRALGIDAKYETMRRHPAVHYRGMFKDFREAVERQQNRHFDEYVLSCKSDFPWGWSEFATLGAFVLWDAAWRDKYHFIDVGKVPYPKGKLIQFWSHSPIDQAQGLPSGGTGTPMEEYRRLGLV